jgi:hypothetical protein
MKGTLLAVGLLVGVACTGSGSPNDFGPGLPDDALTAPGAPSDPNAPPGDGQFPPYGGTAPGVPGEGTTSDRDCNKLCNDFARACGVSDADDTAECIDECAAFPASCIPVVSAYVRCLVESNCAIEVDACEGQGIEVGRCVDANGGGEGGQGGM